MENELKPCPFCGETPTLEKDELIDSWFIECHDEKCIATPFALLPNTPKEDVVSAWNTRANGKEVEVRCPNCADGKMMDDTDCDTCLGSGKLYRIRKD